MIKKLILTAIIVLTFLSCSQSEDITIAEGSIESAEVIVSAEGTGRILSFDAVEGTEVAQGQVIGTIDDLQLVLQREQLVAARKRVESQIPDISVQTAPLEAQLVSARADQTRITRLLAADAASQKQKDDIDSRVNTLTSQLAALRQTLEQSTESLELESESLSYQISQLDDRIAKCTITSPIAGTLLTSYAEAGELAAPGKALFKVADLENVFLRAYISASQLTTITLGDSVKVMVDYGVDGQRYYDGRVSWISEKAEFTPKTVQTRDERAALVYAVKVSLLNDGYLKLGMYGSIVEAQ